MSEFMDKIYDDMSWQEVICRLPGEMAVRAVQRRMSKAENLNEFFDAAAVEKETSKCDDVRRHVNDLVSRYDDISDVLGEVKELYHPVLHGYLNDHNRERLLSEGANKLSVTFHFNLTDAEDLPGMRNVLDRILAEPKVEYSKVLSVLNKIVPEHFQSLAEVVLKDSRPSVCATLLSVANGPNYETISDHQKMISLKAFAKIPSSEAGPKRVQPVDFNLFKSMKPLERLLALDKYLSYFPVYQKRKAFDPAPTEDEFDAILFAGCFQYYDLVESIKNKYKAVTEEESPDA